MVEIFDGIVGSTSRVSKFDDESYHIIYFDEDDNPLLHIVAVYDTYGVPTILDIKVLEAARRKKITIKFLRKLKERVSEVNILNVRSSSLKSVLAGQRYRPIYGAVPLYVEGERYVEYYRYSKSRDIRES